MTSSKDGRRHGALAQFPGTQENQHLSLDGYIKRRHGFVTGNQIRLGARVMNAHRLSDDLLHALTGI
jgi:hypothetical protein